jgi:hypothetical protein
LKSNANTFGAIDLAILAKELESMAKEHNFEIGNRLEVLREAYGKAVDVLEELRV